jgi:hypothetical protein
MTIMSIVIVMMQVFIIAGIRRRNAQSLPYQSLPKSVTLESITDCINWYGSKGRPRGPDLPS